MKLLPSASSSPTPRHMPHTNIPALENHSEITPRKKYTWERGKHNLLATHLLGNKSIYCRHLEVLNLFFTKPRSVKLMPRSDSTGKVAETAC